MYNVYIVYNNKNKIYYVYSIQCTYCTMYIVIKFLHKIKDIKLKYHTKMHTHHIIDPHTLSHSPHTIPCKHDWSIINLIIVNYSSYF